MAAADGRVAGRGDRDAKRGEVTVMSGTSETTYRDRALVKRLMDAAPTDSNLNGGGLDVVAP